MRIIKEDDLMALEFITKMQKASSRFVTERSLTELKNIINTGWLFIGENKGGFPASSAYLELIGERRYKLGGLSVCPNAEGNKRAMLKLLIEITDLISGRDITVIGYSENKIIQGLASAINGWELTSTIDLHPIAIGRHFKYSVNNKGKFIIWK